MKNRKTRRGDGEPETANMTRTGEEVLLDVVFFFGGGGEVAEGE
jgi:hypothetical protein